MSIEQELLDLAKQLGPEVVKAIAGLLKDALGGSSEDQLKRKAEKLAVLTAFKASYRVGRKP
jgi:hypothetical protein